MARSYSGLLVWLRIGLSYYQGCWSVLDWGVVVSKIPASVFAGFVVAAFYLVDRDQRFTFLFSWLVAALIANLQLSDSWLRRSPERQLADVDRATLIWNVPDSWTDNQRRAVDRPADQFVSPSFGCGADGRRGGFDRRAYLACWGIACAPLPARLSSIGETHRNSRGWHEVPI